VGLVQAPDAREPIPLLYLRVRASVIPLAPHDKRPYLDVLEGRTWAPYQQRRASEDEVRRWLAQGHDHNWGVVCGQVSDGLYCGDIDDSDFAVWVLDHARDPLLRGACVVESGSGKAHIWFRCSRKVFSGKWRPARGTAVGDIRGDGNGTAGASYMVVPPSIHPDTGKPYKFVKPTTFSHLPVIDDGDRFLADVLQAYLGSNPTWAPREEPSNSKHILELTDEEAARVWNRVRTLGLKRKILDTLVIERNQSPGTRHWTNMVDASHSGIDFAVIKELVLKDQTFEQIEQIYAACLVGIARYRNRDSKHNYGYAYLKTTYDNVLRAIAAERLAARAAVGANFEVLKVERERFDHQTSRFWLTLKYRNDEGFDVFPDRVWVTDDDLLELKRVEKAFFKQIQFVPLFTNAQQGRQFSNTFGAAVAKMVSDITQAPEAYTRLGPTAVRLRELMRRLPKEPPADEGDMDRLGWRVGESYWLVAHEIVRVLRADDHALKNEDGPALLSLLGDFWRATHRWPDGTPLEMIVLTLRAT
jgi:hypothetical protein